MLGLQHSVKPNIASLRAVTWQLEGDSGTCSGVFVSPVKYLTAAHCMQDNMKVDGVAATILKQGKDVDLMLLYVPGNHPYAKVSYYDPELDAPVTVVGFPLSIGQIVTEGRYQGPARKDMPQGKRYRLMTAPIAPGNSGGPVFAIIDGEYKVVGIAVAVAVAPIAGMFPNIMPNLGIIVSAYEVNKFINE